MSYGHWVTLRPPADVFFALPTIAGLHKGAKHKGICLQGGFILTPEGLSAALFVKGYIHLNTPSGL